MPLNMKSVNKEYMIKLFHQLQHMHIPKKHLSMKGGKFKIYMGNVELHMANVLQEYLEWSGIYSGPYPPYSPDLPPNNFFLYPAVKKFIKGQRFLGVATLKSTPHTQ